MANAGDAAYWSGLTKQVGAFLGTAGSKGQQREKDFSWDAAQQEVENFFNKTPNEDAQSPQNNDNAKFWQGVQQEVDDFFKKPSQ